MIGRRETETDGREERKRDRQKQIQTDGQTHIHTCTHAHVHRIVNPAWICFSEILQMSTQIELIPHCLLPSGMAISDVAGFLLPLQDCKILCGYGPSYIHHARQQVNKE